MTKRVRYIVLIYLSISLSGFAQKDSLANAFIAKKNIEELRSEQKELNFQKFFFEALQQKAIGNFDKAISALESCQNIKEGDKAVNFELSKNYFELEKYIEAEAYIKKGLEVDPDNLFMLQLLKDTYNRQSNFKDALEVQKKIIKQKPDSQLDLIILYMKNQQVDNAKQFIIDLEKKGMLSASLLPFKKSLLEGNVLVPSSNSINKPVGQQSIQDLKKAYKTNKSFSVLKELLLKLNTKESFSELEKYSNEAIELFPAQPLVYLIRAKVLKQKKEYKNALQVLQIGFNYIVDDPLLEADYYEQISLNYKKLNENENASKYYNKAIVLRQKKS
jgi:tetratricopeptide (TPR) repeat protein